MASIMTAIRKLFYPEIPSDEVLLGIANTEPDTGDKMPDEARVVKTLRPCTSCGARHFAEHGFPDHVYCIGCGAIFAIVDIHRPLAKICEPLQKPKLKDKPA